MLCSVMLDNPFKAVKPEVILTPITQEKLPAELVGVLLDPHIEHPFHVLQRELLRKWALNGICRSFSSGGKSRSSILDNLGVKPLAHVDQNICREARRVLSSDLAAILPTAFYDLVGELGDPGSDGALKLVPIRVQHLLRFASSCSRNMPLSQLLLECPSLRCTASFSPLCVFSLP